jgi:hypothetical protein
LSAGGWPCVNHHAGDWCEAGRRMRENAKNVRPVTAAAARLVADPARM